MRYGLYDLMDQDRRQYPNGQTFGIIRAVETPSDETTSIAMRLVGASPEDYLGAYALSGGLIAINRTLLAEKVKILPSVRKTRTGWVNSLHFSGEVIADRHFPEALTAVGAYVPGEKGTGYLHVIDGNEQDLFKKRANTPLGILERTPSRFRLLKDVSTSVDVELNSQLDPETEDNSGFIVELSQYRRKKLQFSVGPDTGDYPTAS